MPMEFSGNSVNVEKLQRGVYIYTAVVNGERVTGKFVK